jgi:WD40-like Beta Propeller Repeat
MVLLIFAQGIGLRDCNGTSNNRSGRDSGRYRIFRLAIWVFVQVVILGLGAGGFAYAAHPKLYYQETEHVKVIYYNPADEYLVPYVIRCFENALKFDHKLFNFTPSEKVTILLQDFSDFGYGAGGGLPFDKIQFGIEPLSYVFETLAANERLSTMMNHEMIHVVMSDNGSSSDRRTRKIFFGKVTPTPEDPIAILYSSFCSPRQFAPRWYQEGIAAFMETWLNGGLGRALGGYDEMVFRAKVRDKSYIYSYVGLESEGTAIDFQVGANSYLYGTRFMTFLADRYGVKKLLEWVTRTNSSRRYFASQFRRVYGKPLKEVWDEWIASEKGWQDANLARVRQYPVTKPDHLPFESLGSISRCYYDAKTNTIYAGVRYLGEMANIAALHLDTGRIEHLHDVDGASLYSVTSMAFDEIHHRIFYASDNANWRDLNVLDLATHHARRLIKDTRTGDLVYNSADQSIWGMRHSDGLSSLVRIRPPYNKLEPVYTFPYGTDLFDIDISPDGKDLTGSLSNLSGEQKLVRFTFADLLAGNKTPETLYDFKYNSPENFVYSPDGRYLYGSSYQTGVSNIFRYDFQTKKMEVLSNAETGLFRPLPLPNGRLIALDYTAKGFVPSYVPTTPLNDVSAINYLGQDLFEKTPLLKTWKLPPPSTINTEKVITSTGSYSPLRSTRPHGIYPIVQGYKNTAAVGLRMDMSDGLRLAGGDVTATYSPDTMLPLSERFHFGFQGHLWNWTVTSYYNNADFYDLFGPTKVSRKGEALKFEDTHNLIYDTPRTLDLNWSLAAYSGLETLPDYQNVSTPISRFLIGRVGLKYDRMGRSLGAIEDEEGTQWQLVTDMSYAGGKAFPQVYGTFDHGFLLPIHNSSIWFRSSAGKGFGDSNSPFTNFFFGGFGNNWVDHGSISRYRDYYSFPGVKLDQIPATSFTKLLGEWDLPPVRFRRVGSTVLYVNWARLALFSSGLVTNLGQSGNRQEFGNLGAQMDFRTVFFTYFQSTFSTGYALARDNHGNVTSEYLVSLKLL